VAVERHVGFWNAMDRDAWVAIFSPEVTFEDPVGGPLKRGLEAVHNSWDRSFVPGRRWTLHPTFVVGAGSECAVAMTNRGDLDGRLVETRSIEIFRVGDDGRIVSVRSFFDQPTDFELSPYFSGRVDD
jgi:steroid delta-isomerase